MNHMLDPDSHSQCYPLFTHDHARIGPTMDEREHMLRHKSNGTIDCKIVIGPPNMVTFMASRDIYSHLVFMKL